MRRREFVTGLAGAATAWPAALTAQAAARHMGVLSALGADDVQVQGRVAAFRERLAQLGWMEGRNLRIDYRWGADAERGREYAAELVALRPEVILATGGASLTPLLQVTRTVPVIFANVPDPIGSGFVESLAKPGGNATGFLLFEYSLSSKWPELLKEIAPGVTRAAVVRDAAIPFGIGQFAVIQSVAPSLGLEVSPINLRDTAQTERAVASFARSSTDGMIVTASALSTIQSDLIVSLAARHRLPTVYFQRFFVPAGGLISYGPNLDDQFRGAAGYVDRILKGEKPAEMPVQAPTRYELVINARTAARIGLTIPPTLLARADKVIE
jgi:putative tryptophan/tyrosine transport system substrate-binding protein